MDTDHPRIERSVESLCSRLDTLMTAKGGPLVVGIDGFLSVGKTKLAKQIAVRLNGKEIHVDKHVDMDKGSYTESVRCPEILAALASQNHLAIIIDGVCLRAVAQRCHFRVDTHVYVRSTDEQGSWWERDHKEICMDLSPAEEVKDRERALGALDVRLEVIDYHYRYRPFQSADLVFDLAVCAQAL